MEQATSKDGTHIGYERSGTGPPLVEIHGTAADHTRWRSVLPPLVRRVTVIAVELQPQLIITSVEEGIRSFAFYA
jgi:pimeloyl-ACP methyl ester carboxylesterase